MPVNTQKLRRSLESARQDEKNGVKGKEQQFWDNMKDAFEKRHFTPEEFSIRQLFEQFVPNGREIVESWMPTGGYNFGDQGYNVRSLEAGGFVKTSDFTNISGQILFTRTKDAFESPNLLWQQLVEVIPTRFDGEKIPGIGRIGDEAEKISEGDPYPMAGVNEEWIETPRTDKRGFIVPVSKESIFFDRTGILLRRASEVGEWLALGREKRVLDAITGVTNTYKRNGSATNTYLSAGDYVNTKSSNALQDWTDIENVLLLFPDITDPNTGEPINVQVNQLLVPQALEMTARRIVTATELRSTEGSNQEMISGNPLNDTGSLNNGGPRLQVLSNAYVSDRSSSSSTWFLGNFRRAFALMENWPITVVEAPDNSEAEFERDIVSRFKASERSAVAVVEPRFAAKSTT